MLLTVVNIIVPRNHFDKTTCIQTGASQTPYDLIHINVLYDLENEIYHDFQIQDKVNNDERSAFIDMMENSLFRPSTCHQG